LLYLKRAGTMIVFDDDGVTPALTATIYENWEGSVKYRGQGVESRDKLD